MRIANPIEIQKAKLVTDIMRFRRYLGEQYRDPNNAVTETDGRKQALPLLTVYFFSRSHAPRLGKYSVRTFVVSTLVLKNQRTKVLTTNGSAILSQSRRVGMQLHRAAVRISISFRSAELQHSHVARGNERRTD